MVQLVQGSMSPWLFWRVVWLPVPLWLLDILQLCDHSFCNIGIGCFCGIDIIPHLLPFPWQCVAHLGGLMVDHSEVVQLWCSRGAVVVSLACTYPDAPSIDYHDVLSPVPVLGGYRVSQGVQSGPSVILVGHHRTGSVVPHLPILPLTLVC